MTDVTEQLERELRVLFAEDAERAPRPTGLAARARRAAPAPRKAVGPRRRLAWGAGLLVAASASAAALFAVGMLPGTGDTSSPSAATDSADRSPSSGPTGDRTGPLPAAALTSCAAEYSPRALAGMSFAFDGTVTAIEEGVTDRAGAGPSDYAGVTFAVTEWFRGEGGATVTVDMDAPTDVTAAGETVPSYAVGTRLLVSGEPRWGGAPLDDPIAWGCGFTRYYDASTAADWRRAGG